MQTQHIHPGFRTQTDLRSALLMYALSWSRTRRTASSPPSAARISITISTVHLHNQFTSIRKPVNLLSVEHELIKSYKRFGYHPRHRGDSGPFTLDFSQNRLVKSTETTPWNITDCKPNLKNGPYSERGASSRTRLRVSGPLPGGLPGDLPARG